MDSLRLDLRHALRSLAKQPVFALVSVVSLALGIGVNTAIFSALNSLLLRPPAVQDLDRTVYVYDADPANPDKGTSFPAFEQYRNRRETFSAVAAISGARPVFLTDGDRRDQVYAELVTADFFAIADARLHLGRPFDRDADRIVDPPLVTVLSDTLWRRRFASDPAIVGRSLDLNGRAFTVVGVAGPRFTGLDAEVAADLWIPMTAWAHLAGEPARLTSDEHWITTIAQLEHGVTLQQARASASTVGGPQARVRPASERSVRSAPEIVEAGASAFAVGLLVLLLSCTNVTNLLMARAAARQQEMSVRVALGGSRGRLIRLWLAETSLICVAAGAGALVIASWLLALIVGFKPPAWIGQTEAPTLPLDLHLDVRVFVFTLGLSALTAMVVGVFTGLHASSATAVAAIKNARVSDRRFAPGFNTRSAVIALQMALSMLLLVTCGLFVRSWLNASTIAPGFSTDHVLLLPISSDQTGIRVQKPPDFDRALLAQVSALPGVEAATMMDPVPLWFGGNFAGFSIDSIDDASRASVRVGFARIAPGYFETLRLPLVSGRDFVSSDAASAPPVAIVNETMARRSWPGRSALGQRIRNGEEVIEVVGVAKDAKYQSLAEPAQPWLYRPLAQWPTDNAALSLAVRVTGDPMRLSSAIEREVKALVPSWPAFQFRTLDEGLQVQQLVPRLGATLLGVLGVFGLLLAAAGVYGVMSYVVKQRIHEIGIRLALGSPINRVLALIIRQGMAVCVTGAAVGLAAALVVAQLLASVLYAVSGFDLLAYVAAPLLLLAVAFLACYVPARQIAKINPVEALRHD